MKMFGKGAFSTAYECAILEKATELVVVAPQSFVSLDEVGIFIKRHYPAERVDYLVHTIEMFTDGRSKQFNYTWNNKILTVKFHYYPEDEEVS